MWFNRGSMALMLLATVKSAMQLNRIKFSAVIFLSLFYTEAYAQEQPFFTAGKSLAFEMGKTYQRAKNCGHELANISKPSAVALFQNYFPSPKVTLIMQQFELSVAKEKTESCNLGSIQSFALMHKMGMFMRMTGSASMK